MAEVKFERVEVTNEETLESLRTSVGILLALVDGEPTLLWRGEDGEGWFGTRGVNEDDGPWEDIPAETRETLAVRASVDLTETDDCLPLTVLWADGPFTVYPDDEDDFGPAVALPEAALRG